MLELLKIIRVSHIVACPVVFILFYGRDWQGGVFKVMKNDHFFKYFYQFCFLSPSFSTG